MKPSFMVMRISEKSLPWFDVMPNRHDRSRLTPAGSNLLYDQPHAGNLLTDAVIQSHVGLAGTSGLQIVTL